MRTILEPSTVAELVDCVRSAPRILAIGAGTKPRLSQVSECFVRLSTARVRGIIEYEPAEFTITALAGTPVLEIIAALAEHGQCMPFDPMLAEAGSTLGGAVASGLSSSGRFRYGGLRDFILGVRFVDGSGRLLRMGGKVVKNAAGFDLPKFLVGSLGRFGVLAELTFKVFPKPGSYLTLELEARDEVTAAEILNEVSNGRWQVDALDIAPPGQAVCVRLAGPDSALQPIAREILNRRPGKVVASSGADGFWKGLREFLWAHSDGVLVKSTLTPAAVPTVLKWASTVDCLRVHVSSGGQVAFVSFSSTDPVPNLGRMLEEQGMAAMTLRGQAPLWLGAQRSWKITDAVKNALDPDHRFPGIEDD